MPRGSRTSVFEKMYETLSFFYMKTLKKHICMHEILENAYMKIFESA